MENQDLTKEIAFVKALYLNATPEQREELKQIAKNYSSNATGKTKIGQWLADAAHAMQVNMSNLPKAINETLTAVTDPLRTETTTTTKTETGKKDEKDNTMMYVGIAGGAVLVILIIVFFIYKKP